MANIGNLPQNAWANNRTHPMSGAYPDNPQYGDRIFRRDLGMWMNYVYPDTTKPHIPNSYLWVPDAGQLLFSGRRTAVQSIPNAVNSFIIPTLIDTDPFNAWNASGYWTAPFPGAFNVSAGQSFTNSATNRYLWSGVAVGSLGLIWGSISRQNYPSTNNVVVACNSSASGIITNADYIGATTAIYGLCFQNTGGALNSFVTDGLGVFITYAGPVFKA